MSRILSKKLRAINDTLLYHWCPGCKEKHCIDLTRWAYNGNAEEPTFEPSINIIGKCHYFLSKGVLVFCGDCAHEFAGVNVPLPEYPTC